MSSVGMLRDGMEGWKREERHHLFRGHGRARRDSSSLAIALSEFLWRKRYNDTLSDDSIRRTYCKEIPDLMERLFKK